MIKWWMRHEYYVWGKAVHAIVLAVVMSYCLVATYEAWRLHQRVRVMREDHAINFMRLKRIAWRANASNVPSVSPGSVDQDVLFLREAAKQSHGRIRALDVRPAPFISSTAHIVQVQFESSFPHFTEWITRVRQSQKPLFLKDIRAVLSQEEVFSVEWIRDPQSMSFALNRKTERVHFSHYDPFCLHDASAVSRAYQNDPLWHRYINFSELAFKTDHWIRHQHWALVSWRGKLFWLAKNQTVFEHPVVLKRIFSDHLEFVFQTGRRISIRKE